MKREVFLISLGAICFFLAIPSSSQAYFIDTDLSINTFTVSSAPSPSTSEPEATPSPSNPEQPNQSPGSTKSMSVTSSIETEETEPPPETIITEEDSNELETPPAPEEANPDSEAQQKTQSVKKSIKKGVKNEKNQQE